VRALPLAGGINEGGHYFIYFSFLLFSPLKKNNTNSGEKNKIWTPTPWPPGGRFLVFFWKILEGGQLEFCGAFLDFLKTFFENFKIRPRVLKLRI
jgi:hypothetical protein